MIVFAKFKDNLRHERRLENLSWRLWHHSKSRKVGLIPSSIKSNNQEGQVLHLQKKQDQEYLPHLSSSSLSDSEDSLQSRELPQQTMAIYARDGSNDAGLFIDKQDLFALKRPRSFIQTNPASPPEWFSDDEDDDDETVFDEEFQKQLVPRPPQERFSLLSYMLRQQQQQLTGSATAASTTTAAAAAAAASVIATGHGADSVHESNLLSESLRCCIDWERQQNTFGGGIMPHRLSWPTEEPSWSDAATFIPSMHAPASYHRLQQSISSQPPSLHMPWIEPFQGW
ncbi:hypothetical protein BX666DRAFT_1971103 [Dichotomocladium elegans]|nr:hypothetical protein BX666DRAFT_1971103 [Dichotomocladium elegans]